MPLKTYKGRIKSLQLDAIELKTLGGKYTFEGWASRPVVDAYREVVDVQAFGDLTRFRTNPIMLYQHDAKQPIGIFPKLALQPDGLWVGGVIGSGFDPADKVRAMVEQKILKTMSIGFRETKRGIVDKDGIYHIVGLELLEISIVSIPANQEAIFSLSEDGKLLAVEPLAEPSVRSGLTPAQQRELKRLRFQAAALDAQLAVRDLAKAADHRHRQRYAAQERTLDVLASRIRELTA